MYEADTQKNIRDNLSYIGKHKAEEQKVGASGLESIDRDMGTDKIDSDEEDLMNGDENGGSEMPSDGS